MSYSFNARGKSRSELMNAISEKLDEVVKLQVIHQHDRTLAENVAGDVLAHVGEPSNGNEFSANIHGSCFQRDGVFGGVSIGVDISHQRPFADDV